LIGVEEKMKFQHSTTCSEGGKVIKTIAHTEFGLYFYYYTPNEQVDTTGNYANKQEVGYRNMFRLQCLKLAKEQLSLFQAKRKGR
jgi:hypothetical protein